MSLDFLVLGEEHVIIHVCDRSYTTEQNIVLLF